jgi:hypothetical protein
MACRRVLSSTPESMGFGNLVKFRYGQTATKTPMTLYAFISCTFCIGIIIRMNAFVTPFYLQSVPVHSANYVKDVYSGM